MAPVSSGDEGGKWGCGSAPWLQQDGVLPHLAVMPVAAGTRVELVVPKVPDGCCWGFWCRTGMKVGGYMMGLMGCGRCSLPRQGALGAGQLLNLLLWWWVAPYWWPGPGPADMGSCHQLGD